MPYGTVKVDNITFDNGGADQNVTVSGIHRAITSGVTVTGTISGAVLIGTTTVSGATVTGTAIQGTTIQGVSGTFTSLTGTTTTGTTANFVSGVFTTRVSGTTVTGNTGQFTSGTFVSLTGTTITGTTVNAVTVSSTTGTFGSITGTTITGTTINGATVNSTTGNFTSLTGVTVTGTTAQFVSGVFTTQVSGLTVTGTQSSFTSGNFVTLSGATATFTSGVIASGTATNPSLSIVGDGNTGIYSPGADQLAVATNGTGRLFVDASGNVGVGTGPINIAGFKRIDIGEAGVSGGLLTLRSSGGAQEANIGCSATGLAFTTNSFATPFDARASEIILGTGSSGTERLRITSAGLVGIGTSAPAARLSVISADNVAATTIADFGASNGTSAIQLGYNRITQVNSTPASAFLQLGVSNKTDAIHINGTGNVGIGTTSPGAILHTVNTSAGAATVGAFIQNSSLTAGTEVRLGFAPNTNVVGDNRYSWIGAVNGAGSNDSSLTFATTPGGTGATERMRIDSSGRLLVGTSTARRVGVVTAGFEIIGDVDKSAISSSVYSNDSAGPYLSLGKSRGVSDGSYTSVTENDQLGNITFSGADGSTLNSIGAAIVAHVDGTPGANDMPGRLMFLTTADGAASPTERMRITSAGLVGLGTSSPLTKLDVRSGVITAGSSSSPNGTEILRGYYSDTDGALAIIGTEYSSGGIVIGSAVKPSTSSAGAFFSSTNINVARGAYTIAGNVHKWYIGSAQTVAENSSVSTSEVMRIDSSGRLGIGTTSPGYLLDVASSVAQVGNSTDAFIQYKSTAGNWHVGANSSNAYVFYSGSYGSGSERARIDSSGRLLVGTSSDSGGALLQVNGDRIRVGTAKTPATSGATGAAGEIAWDADYIYVCTAANTWKRTAIATW